MGVGTIDREDGVRRSFPGQNARENAGEKDQTIYLSDQQYAPDVYVHLLGVIDLNIHIQECLVERDGSVVDNNVDLPTPES